MIHMVIHCIDKGAEAKAYRHKNNSASQFPFPGNKQKNNQDKRGDQVDQESADLLPEGQFRIKRIHCKHADEQDCKDAKDAGDPVNEFCACFHRQWKNEVKI